MTGTRFRTRPGLMLATIAMAIPTALGATACDSEVGNEVNPND